MAALRPEVIQIIGTSMAVLMVVVIAISLAALLTSQFRWLDPDRGRNRALDDL